jgi:DNA primase small subunit
MAAAGKGLKRTHGTSEGCTSDLGAYYSHLFPYDLIFRWLRYEDHAECDAHFANREFSFTVQKDIVFRHKDFETVSGLREEIHKLQPLKFDLGAIYQTRPRDHTVLQPDKYQPKERELCFDIDITDYDDIRTCCKESNICVKCWKLLVVAIKVLDTALRDDLGFKHLFWVFSGRRGVHCWVCDKRARVLTDEGRTCIAMYLRSQAVTRRISGTQFLEILADQQFLNVEPGFTVIRDLLSPPLKCCLVETISQDPHSTSEQRWAALVAHTKQTFETTEAAAMVHNLDEIVSHCMRPRLDLPVTTQTKHLLRAPWSVHAGTGKVCLPINPAACAAFDPCSVPTVQTLISELESGTGTQLDSHLKWWKTTFLAPLERDIREALD